MRGFLAALRAAPWLVWLVLCIAIPRESGGQVWNDSATRALVQRATTLRAQQLADTGLTAYQARAHGYVTFLGQFGREYFTPPKLLKADELELEVYWHAPNLSKQRIIGRRDTLLLPTDIQYHTDHLGIVQNNFPSVIRIGEGDEVADVPHPLSAAGLGDYDFAMGDSLRIGFAGRTIRVYEVKVRPRDDRQPRVVGAVYIDPSEGQVVRMAFNFTHAAFLDKSLEDLSIVLENSLVQGKFWLPSHQEIEIRRSGTWMDTPVRGIIRGRWEISDYTIGTSLPVQELSQGPEIVGSMELAQKSYPWKGAVLDSLPPDERAPTDADIAKVQTEARALVRAQALARARRPNFAFQDLSDIVHVNRVEGLAIGAGVVQPLGVGLSARAHARYGLDSRTVYGGASLGWQRPSGAGLRLFGMRDLRDVGDVTERSGALNSLAAQEFGSDDTDPYLVRGGGIGVDLPRFRGQFWQLNASLEQQDSVGVHATPVQGTYGLTIPAMGRRLIRTSLVGERATSLWLWGTELGARTELRGTWDLHDPVTLEPLGIGGGAPFIAVPVPGARTLRAMLDADIERPFDDDRRRLVTRTVAAALWSSGVLPAQELVYFGGPVSGPGYDFHSLSGRAALSEHVEWRTPIPFIPFSLGRFGKVPGTATIAPYAHAVVVGGSVYPALGAALLSPFNLIRLDVARGLNGPRGRWTFGVDVDPEFWSIL